LASLSDISSDFSAGDRLLRDVDVRLDQGLDLVLVRLLVLVLLARQPEELFLEAFLAVIELVVEPLGNVIEHGIHLLMLLEEQDNDHDHRDDAGAVREQLDEVLHLGSVFK